MTPSRWSRAASRTRSHPAAGVGVWRVAALGLFGAAAVAVLGLFRLGQLEDVARQQQAESTRQDAATHALVEVQELMDNLALSGAARQDDAVSELRSRLRGVARDLQGSVAMSAGDRDDVLSGTAGWIAEGEALAARLLGTTRRRALLEKELDAEWRQLRARLIGLRRDSAIWHGEARLEQLRWLRDLEHGREVVSGVELAATLRRAALHAGSVFEEFDRELRELEVALDRLRSSERVADVEDLRHNRIDPTMERVRHVVAVLDREAEGWDAAGADLHGLAQSVGRLGAAVLALAGEGAEDQRLQDVDDHQNPRDSDHRPRLLSPPASDS